MSKFQAFMKQNKKGTETVKFRLPNFDAELEIRVITGRENEALQKGAMRRKSGKGGRQEQEFDGMKYNRELCIASLVVPNLNDTALQESYGVVGATDLFGEMFNWAEQAQIIDEITKASGFDKDINDYVEEAKN